MQVSFIIRIKRSNTQFRVAMITALPDTDDRLHPPTLSTVAGILCLLAAAIIGFAAVVIGDGLTNRQITSPVIGGFLWPLSAGFAAVISIVSAPLLMMIILGMIESIATPKFLDQAEYSLIGIGGMTGTIVATIVCLSAWTTGTDPFGGSLPAGAGESVISLAMVAFPLTYGSYYLYKPKALFRR